MNQSLNFKKTDYFKFAKMSMCYFGQCFCCKTEEKLIKHMHEFIKLYQEIKKKGFDILKGKIVVFKTVKNREPIDDFGRPHPPTKTYIPKDYIYDGHHRAAILTKLDYEEIEVEFI